MASLLRSWARRAARLARDMQDVSPISASNETVASFRSERCVSERWRAWSDAAHGGTSTASVAFVETAVPAPRHRRALLDGNDASARTGALHLRGALSVKTTAPLRDAPADVSAPDETRAGGGRLGTDPPYPSEPDPDPEDPESLLTERETARSGYEARLAAVGAGGEARGRR